MHSVAIEVWELIRNFIHTLLGMLLFNHVSNTVNPYQPQGTQAVSNLYAD